MTVAELIAKLQQMNPDMDVSCDGRGDIVQRVYDDAWTVRLGRNVVVISDQIPLAVACGNLVGTVIAK